MASLSVAAAREAMRLGPRGEALIKSFEEMRLESYHGAADPTGVWTIGWGSTRGVGPGMRITEEEAEARFAKDVAGAEIAVNAGMRRPTTQAQFDAMVSLAFNVGAGNWRGSSVMRLHNLDMDFAACRAFTLWIKSAGRKRRGLMRRRCLEAALYCEDRWQTEEQ